MEIISGVQVNRLPGHARRLIGYEPDDFVRIDRSTGGNAGYRINERKFAELRDFWSGDWQDFRLPDLGRVAYSGAGHAAHPKQANITVLADWSTERRGVPVTIAASSMGHDHLFVSGAPPSQEVYEFHSQGALLTGRNAALDLWIAKPGDKVVAPADSHMTLYNLGGADQPLVTLDFADWTRNLSSKDRIRATGPAMLLYYDGDTACFTINRKFNQDLPMDPARRTICVRLTGRSGREELLYDRLTGDFELAGQFLALGVRLRKASPEVRLVPAESGPPVSVSLPLRRLARPGTALYDYYFPDLAAPIAGLAAGDGRMASPNADSMVAKEAVAAQRRASVAGYGPLTRRLTVLVEGPGDWARKAYRPAFERLASRGLSVFYANDSTWSKRPSWAEESELRPWETYLDKADPRNLAIYQKLIPDIVFIVTPDCTHSAVASSWVTRRGPLCCVEKPFDSELGHVDNLIAVLGRHPFTAILGLDHYQLRARHIHDRMPEIAAHLGGALSSVEFYMTESKPLDLARVKSLQFGLTLDMLPHLFALIPYFGDLSSVDEIRVLEAGRYEPFLADDGRGNRVPVPPVFRGETFSKVEFTFEDYSGSGVRVPCTATVGKGLVDRKYFEVRGVNGNSIRLDFGSCPERGNPSYGWNGLMFFSSPGRGASGAAEVADPFDPSRTLSIERFVPMETTPAVYARLLEDLLCAWEGREAMGRTLLLPEAREVVLSLDRIWKAIQDVPGGPARVGHVSGRELDSSAVPAAGIG